MIKKQNKTKQTKTKMLQLKTQWGFLGFGDTSSTAGNIAHIHITRDKMTAKRGKGSAKGPSCRASGPMA